jgi:hypothetical protein
VRGRCRTFAQTSSLAQALSLAALKSWQRSRTSFRSGSGAVLLTEVMANEPDDAYVEREGRIEKVSGGPRRGLETLNVS